MRFKNIKKLIYGETKNTDIDFHLFQRINNIGKKLNMIFNIFNFYDTNFIGNKDFVQIPTLKDVIENVIKYPMIIAARNVTFQDEEIIGVTTIKIEKNNNITDNPYFPSVNEKILFIIGILTKLNLYDNHNNRIKGIGKELYKLAIQGAYDYNKYEKIKLVCKIDCRNQSSINALVKAVTELQQDGVNVRLLLSGYYEIIDKHGNLIEAPTFTFEIDLNTCEMTDVRETKFSYIKCKKSNLFENISKIISDNVYEQNRLITYDMNKVIIYHKIKPIDGSYIKIEVGNSADGNNRVPIKDNIICNCIEGVK